MNEITIEELLENLMQSCGLGTVISPLESVSGGFMHRMYKVTTDCGTYAVKHLNREIMDRETAHDNFERAERIEVMLEKEGIPIVPALTFHGSKMQKVEENYFYIFNWQEGHITDWNNISEIECHTAGNILGRIHAIAPQNVPHKEPVLSEIDWQGYVTKAEKEKSEIAPVLAENKELLSYAEEEMNKARAVLPDILCVSNEDMDPKNIMW
ncbi:MAG: phosphotransferase, partial [Lachnospiraceae bacterium]